MMFSTSYFLKPSLFPHLIRVSIVFEIPTSTSLISFLLNSYKKFYATCVGFLLNITSTSSMNTTHTSLNFFSISLFINLCVVIAELPPFPKSSLPITRCTSYKVFTILAFIEMTLQSYLERMVLAVRVFPAPGAPVSIRNRIPFFQSSMQDYKNDSILLLSLSRNLKTAGTLVPFKRSSASAFLSKRL